MSSAISSIASALPIPWEAAEPRRAGGEPAWVAEIMYREGEAITRMLWRLLGNEADVLDAFQDTFCRLAGRGSADLRSARAYVFRTASNIGIELIRGRKRQERHRDAIANQYGLKLVREEDTEVESAAGSIRNDRLRVALGLLPRHLQNVVVLRDLAGLRYEEIAGILRIGAATARVYRRHAIVRLARIMGGE